MNNSRTSNYSDWYDEIIKKSDIAENSSTKGCIIMKPFGYALWENIQKVLDLKIKKSGHQNVYFPLLIPKSYFTKEAEHVKGFAKECAIVTHYRLKQDENNNIIVDPNAKLQDEYIVRPTSETVIWNTFSNWIKSYRDLPIKINQWANVCRWEMRTKPFLRTTEFLWQEGHTAHISYQEALQETVNMQNMYYEFCRDYLSIPTIKGIKPEHERFAGAQETYTLEALMQDGKALQIATSHLLGLSFSKAFDVKYLDNNGKYNYVYGTSWGITTRLIGAIIMVHGDDKGLVLPPKISPVQIVIVPVIKNNDDISKIRNYINEIVNQLQDCNVQYIFDDNENYTPGWKFNKYELQGIPIRITVGNKDIENNTIEIYRRDTYEKNYISKDKCIDYVTKLLDDIQKNLYNKALYFMNEHTSSVNDYDEFINKINTQKGFIYAHWDRTERTAKEIQNKHQMTIRCIPLDDKYNDEGKCIITGNKSIRKVIFAQSY